MNNRQRSNDSQCSKKISKVAKPKRILKGKGEIWKVFGADLKKIIDDNTT